ncbi:GIY-YIG nuclease family protein [Magnetofaba australis]|uniref:GIY-YIG domain-containing protein n=1 Tax=Magnetofaba australis IT-1 TaxID=1434232 RepID=A0A1Y2K6L6_9PROT|nr:GIY-YIG nuclease family protein [Magnetofaba australis]OSM05180.1 hypothetical protein MAIT1_03338 [Magnetofaba australis IT-1]
MASYVLEIDVARAITVTVGALGEVRLRRGRHLYVGSAKKAWNQRIARHMARTKKLRWHADYITTHSDVRVTQAWISPVDQECDTAQALMAPEVGAQPAWPRLGASDCHCAAHLLVVGKIRPIRTLLKQRGFVVWRQSMVSAG